MRLNELKAILERHKIPTESWGRGEAKTLSHLLAEIHGEEVVLQEESDRLLRVIATVMLDVYCAVGNKVLVLKEDRQIFHDGRCRSRSLNTSLGEKMKRGEKAEEAARRALREELCITENLPFTQTSEPRTESAPSRSFPGLLTMNTHYTFKVSLPQNHYRAEGYIERQSDKTTYFVWETKKNDSL